LTRNYLYAIKCINSERKVITFGWPDSRPLRAHGLLAVRTGFAYFTVE
jgi:hypothetical protein